MKKLVIAALLLVLGGTAAHAANYLEAAAFKGWLSSGKKVHIVDVQPPADYTRHHFKGSIRTNAFPGKTEEEKKRLDPALQQIAATRDDVVIVCPRGGGGAKNAYQYLLEKGIDEKRLHILQQGMAGWPYAELLVQK